MNQQANKDFWKKFDDVFTEADKIFESSKNPSDNTAFIQQEITFPSTSKGNKIKVTVTIQTRTEWGVIYHLFGMPWKALWRKITTGSIKKKKS